jgi:hypothetical protein
VLIVNYAMHKQKTLFFFLLQARTAAGPACCLRYIACRFALTPWSRPPELRNEGLRGGNCSWYAVRI